jgi:hypothetical protein
MTKYAFLSAMALWWAVSLPAAAEAGGSSPITAGQVAAAITRAGIEIAPDQVTLLSNVVAATATPALKVESMQRWGQQRMSVRLGCEQEGECLPFYVAVHPSPGETAPGAYSERGQTAQLEGASVSPSRPNESTGLFTVKAGSPVVLTLDGDHMHIQLVAICIDSGSIGQTIRVASRDHREVYAAQVVDATHVRGRL